MNASYALNSGAQTFEDLTQRNIEAISALEQAMASERTASDRVADRVAGFCGSMAFVWVHVVWFTIWTTINTVPGIKHIDPFPFALLTLMTSLEAIFLTTFVLISQNHQGRASERRNHLDLQVNLLTEQENSKMLAMLAAIMQRLDIQPADHEIHILQQETQPEKLAKQIEETIEQDGADNQT